MRRPVEKHSSARLEKVPRKAELFTEVMQRYCYQLRDEIASQIR